MESFDADFIIMVFSSPFDGEFHYHSDDKGSLFFLPILRRQGFRWKVVSTILFFIFYFYCIYCISGVMHLGIGSFGDFILQFFFLYYILQRGTVIKY